MQHRRIAGNSLEPSLLTWARKRPEGQGNDLVSKNVKDWMIRSQASSAERPEEGSETKWRWAKA